MFPFSRQEKWHFTVKKTRGELTQNAVFSSIFQCSPKPKIQSFPRVFMPVNSSIRSIIRQFSVAVNAGKHTFSGVHRSVNTQEPSSEEDCMSPSVATKQFMCKHTTRLSFIG